MRFAQVTSGSIGKIYHTGMGYTTPDGTRYGATNWFNADWREQNNLYEIKDGMIHNEIFYSNGAASLEFDDKRKIVIETITRKERGVDDIKKTLLDKTELNMKAALESTNWHIDRKTLDSSYTIPTDVEKHRKDVYTKYDSYIKNINAKNKHDTLLAMMISYDKDGKQSGELWDYPVYGEGS
jgi:hypothetical protein